MLSRSMRRVFLVLALSLAGLAGSCSKPALEPALLGETRGLDAEVLQLIEKKVAAVRAAPSDARTHADLGLVYEANGLWDAAEQSFAHALAIDASQTVWLYHRALALREGGASEAALAALREAANKLPADPAVQQRLGHWLLDGGDLDGAQAAFLKALAARPDQPEFLTGLAGVAVARASWDEALTLTKRALKGNPGYRPAFYARGQALQGLGRSEEAKALLAAGMNAKLTWYPDALTREFLGYQLTTSSLSEQASAAVASGEYARAVDLYEKLVQRKPDDPDMLSNLGANLVETNRLERAAEVLTKAAALAPQSFAVQLNLSEMYLRQQKPAEARSAALRAVELGGTVGRTHFQLGKTLALAKDYPAAYRELKSAVELDARDPRMFLALAETTMRMQRNEEARSWCRKSLELDSNSLPGRLIQGSLAVNAGDLAEAREALAALEKIAPQDPRTGSLRNEVQRMGR